MDSSTSTSAPDLVLALAPADMSGFELPAEFDQLKQRHNKIMAALLGS
jgi:hypothetical protein